MAFRPPTSESGAVHVQVTRQEVHGGVQLRAIGLTQQALQAWRDAQALLAELPVHMETCGSSASGAHAWAWEPAAECGRRWVFVHLCSAAERTAIRGEVPPSTPVDRDIYVRAGALVRLLRRDAKHLAPSEPSETLARVKTVHESLGEDEKTLVSVDPATVITLKDSGTCL